MRRLPPPSAFLLFFAQYRGVISIDDGMQALIYALATYTVAPARYKRCGV